MAERTWRALSTMMRLLAIRVAARSGAPAIESLAGFSGAGAVLAGRLEQGPGAGFSFLSALLLGVFRV